MNKFSDDIREYDPLMWINLKKSSSKVKVAKKEKKEILPVIKKKEKETIPITLINEKRRLKNKKNYDAYGKQWYEDNKKRLNELRKKRTITQNSKDNKYLYNKQYYNNNRDELNKKRRIKDKERRDQKKLLS